MNLFDLTAAEIDEVKELCTSAAEEFQAAAAKDKEIEKSPQYAAVKTLLAKIHAAEKIKAAEAEREFCAARIDADYYNFVRADLSVRAAEKKYENLVRSIAAAAAAKATNQQTMPEV